MIVPAVMPARASMAWSAVLLEAGVLILALALLEGSRWTALGALLIVAGLATFVVHVRLMLRHRRPPPAALPRPDWATWQTHVALVWLLTAAVLGAYLSVAATGRMSLPLGWTYGTLGLVGFLSQVIVGIQGRLLPMHGWYRAFEARGSQPPARSAHTLASHGLARAIFFAWTAGVPVLAYGLAAGRAPAIAIASAVLCIGVVLNALQAARIATRATHRH